MATGVGVRHVVRGVHGLADMLLMVVVVMVSMGGRIVLRPASTARRRTARGRGAHVGDSLHLLPSRQMPAVVHHAGLGWAVLWLMR